jgi:hypothetical protein
MPYNRCSASVSFTVSEQPLAVPQWLWIAIAAGAGVAIIGAVAAVMYSESMKR